MDGARALEGGFADPAQQAARTFRAVLEAMARPGSVEAVAGAAPPQGLSVAAGAVLLTLADAETPVWLAPRLAAGPVADWLAFHTNAPVAGARETARFAVGRWEDLVPLDRWPAGQPDYPDRSATLIVELDALEGGPTLRLTGPGIAGTRPFAPALPDGAAAALAANAARYPLGVDLILTAADRVAALPRTTRMGD